MDGIDGEYIIKLTSPTGTKIKPSKSLVMTFRRFSYIASTGYLHQFIPDGLSNVSRKISQLVLNVSMHEVWTRDILSRHLIPWKDKFVQLFILLCCIVNFISFDPINSTKLWFFLRTRKFLYKISGQRTCSILWDETDCCGCRPPRYAS